MVKTGLASSACCWCSLPLCSFHVLWCQVRTREVKLIRFWNYALAAIMVSVLIATQMFAIVTFVWYAWAGNVLDPSIMFPCLMVFDNLRWPVIHITNLLQEFTEALISLKRVSTFLQKKPVSQVRSDRVSGAGLVLVKVS